MAGSPSIDSAAAQELPSGVDAADAGGSCDVPSDAAAAGTVLSPIDAANLLAGQAVLAATSYLDGRSDVDALRGAVSRMMADSLAALVDSNDPKATPLVKMVRLLAVVCNGIVEADAESASNGAALNMRDLWQDIARSTVRAIRYRSWMLCGGDNPPPDVDLIDEQTHLAGLLAKDALGGQLAQAEAETIIRNQLTGESLRREQLRGELAQLEAANLELIQCSEAVTAARHARINAICRQLAGREPRR